MTADSAATDAAQAAMLACLRASGDEWTMPCAWQGGLAQGLAEHAGELALWQSLVGVLALGCLLLAGLAAWQWRRARRLAW